MNLSHTNRMAESHEPLDAPSGSAEEIFTLLTRGLPIREGKRLIKGLEYWLGRLGVRMRATPCNSGLDVDFLDEIFEQITRGLTLKQRLRLVGNLKLQVRMISIWQSILSAHSLEVVYPRCPGTWN